MLGLRMLGLQVLGFQMLGLQVLGLQILSFQMQGRRTPGFRMPGLRILKIDDVRSGIIIELPMTSGLRRSRCVVASEMSTMQPAKILKCS